MTRFIEVEGIETGSRYLVGCEHIISVKEVEGKGALLLLADGTLMEVRQGYGEVRDALPGSEA